MPFCFSLFVVSLQCICFVSSCVYTCPDKPVFTPSSLVVKYGDPAFATCVACQSDCNESLANLEAAGLKEKNGRTLKWKVSSLTEWESDPICFNIDHNGTQCCSTQKVTLYQMPTNVSISVLNHSGPMLEKSRYNLVCEVRDVAPAENLTVTFYRGQTELGKAQFSTPTSRKPENGSFSLSFYATKEDDGAQFSCGAKLELGPEGPQRPLVVRSQSLTATVHCLEATSSAAPQTDSSFTTARSTVTTPSGPTSDVTPLFSLQVHQIILCSVIFVSLQA